MDIYGPQGRIFTTPTGQVFYIPPYPTISKYIYIYIIPHNILYYIACIELVKAGYLQLYTASVSETRYTTTTQRNTALFLILPGTKYCNFCFIIFAA